MKELLVFEKNKCTMIRWIRNFVFEKTVGIVVASMSLHNFIKNHCMTDQEFQTYDNGKLLSFIMRMTHTDEEIVDENSTHRQQI